MAEEYVQDPSGQIVPFSQFGMPNSILQSQGEATLVKQVDPARLLNDIIHGLRGEIKEENEEGGIIWNSIGKPLMNEKGVRAIIVDLSHTLSQNTTLSNLEEDEVGKITVECGKVVISKLAIRYAEWQVDKADLSTIVLTITQPIFFALKRAMKEGDKKFFKTTIRSQETVNIMPRQQEQKKHLWEFWK